MIFPSKKQQYKLALKLSGILVASILIFGLAYLLAGMVGGGLVEKDTSSLGFWDCLYFSTVTITTLGYGDITPSGLSRVVASLEAVFGLVFVGYAVAQIVSLRESGLIEYLANEKFIESYKDCLSLLSDSKELIGDRRRDVETGNFDEIGDYIYRRRNPFFLSLKSMQRLNGYTQHLVDVKKASDLAYMIERGAHHVEELAGFTRRLVKLLEKKGDEWRTSQTTYILKELCVNLETFVGSYSKYTKYETQPYKGGVYRDTVRSIVADIRSTIGVG